MSRPESEPVPDYREWLSAMADGEADSDANERVLSVWQDQAAVRETWSRYHLIGDVLRSEDLAADPQREASILASVRATLALEPVVLAPAARVLGRRVSDVRPGVRWSVGGTLAVAAGFAAVAVVTMFVQLPPSPGMASGSVALVKANTRRVTTLASSASSGAVSEREPQAVVANGALIRSARLDQYLAAHKQFGAAPAIAGTAGFVRSSVAEVPNR